jgi:hypothetical protein
VDKMGPKGKGRAVSSSSTLITLCMDKSKRALELDYVVARSRLAVSALVMSDQHRSDLEFGFLRCVG